MLARLDRNGSPLTGAAGTDRVSAWGTASAGRPWFTFEPFRMSDPPGIPIRPARTGDLIPLVEFLQWAPRSPGASSAPCAAVTGDLANRLLAVRDGAIVGAIHYTPGAGRTAAVSPPRLGRWDPATAADLFRAAAAHARRRHGARLIQTLLVPEGADPAACALERAGFRLLAELIYMRRTIRNADRAAPPPKGILWRRYTRLRHHAFAETIRATYTGSLDCPGLAGLRTVHDSIRTHKRTGTYRPKRWQMAVVGRSPAGVVLVNRLRGRGELVYLGVVPEMRGHGIGRALVNRAIRETAEMGLPEVGLAADARNTPALRLYRDAGFEKTHRHLAYFVPVANLDALG